MVAGEREVVGRASELDALAGFVRRLEAGPAALVLTAPAGMGKTTLWRHGIELARAEGHAVLEASPGAAEGRLSYAGLSDLFADVDPALADRLPRVQRDALDVALLRAAPDVGPAGFRAVATAALTLLRELAQVSPVVVAVDDAAWLDAPTAAVLTFALRRTGSTRVGVLATVRRDLDGSRPPAFVDDVATGDAMLSLDPLSVAAIHAIVQRELGHTLPRPTAVRVTAAAGGNPFFAVEIARELLRLGDTQPRSALPVPGELQTLVRRRLGRLPARTRDALLLASCLSAPRTSLVSEEALAPAEAAGVVRIGGDGRIAFDHPLLAAAVYDSAASGRRRGAHRELAGLVEDPEERALHLALAAPGPDDEVARQLEAGADRARARGAPEAAAELGELAVRLTPASDRGAQLERLCAAAAFQFDAGDLPRAEALLEQALAGAPAGDARARVLQRLGQLHARRSGFAEALELAGRALGEAGPDPAFRAELELDLAYDSASAGDYPGAAGHTHAAVELAEQAGNDVLTAIALGARTITNFMLGRGLAQDDLDRALAFEGPLRTAPFPVRPSYVSGILQLWSGRPREALATLDALRVEAIEQGGESELPQLYVYLVWAAIWHGDLGRAASYVRDAAEIAALLDDPFALSMSLAAAALLHAHQGDAKRARAEATEAAGLFEQLGYRAGAIWPPWALGLLGLAVDDPAAVDAALGGISMFFASIPCDPVLCVFMPDQIEALVALDRADEAAALLEAFETRARAVEREWALAAAARCRSLIRSSRGELDGALEALEEAVARHATLGLPFERARTLLELGRLRRRRKEKRLARAAFEEAATAFRALDLPVWAAKVDAELARVTTRQAPQGLSATEREIAELAAAGLTNRAIAERAFVSVHTVEANLSRAYRKLGIASRAQLARALDELPARAL